LRYSSAAIFNDTTISDITASHNMLHATTLFKPNQKTTVETRC
jgi:hypothetical protein